MSEKNPLSYYEEIAKTQYPKLTPAQQKAKALEEYKRNPESDYTGKRTNNTTSGTQLNPIPSGPQYDWNAFLNNEIIYVPATTNGGVTTEAYIKLPETDIKQPTVVVFLKPSADGKGYELQDADAAAKEFLNNIPKNDSSYLYAKQQLQQYYPGGINGAAYKKSLTQPIGESDIGFMTAIKNSLNEVSAINWTSAYAFAQTPVAQRTSSIPDGFRTYKEFLDTRNILPPKETKSERSSQLTTEMDANAEFNRTVQQYIGNPDLVDKVDALRKAYWNKLHKEELRRISTSTSTSDPITNLSSSTGFSYAALTEQDRIEMRLGLIINGDKNSNSVGIKNATQEALEDEGGLVGAAYGKLKEVAADYGVQLTHQDLLGRVYKSLKPGGVTAGVSPSSMATGLEQEANSIKQAAKVHFKGLANYIDQGLKVSDISSNFQRLKEREMGLTDNAVNIYDDDVQKAIGGPDISSVNDFILGVRSNPLWRKTPKANEMAATFINTILKSWGKVG
jgi:hypothetical protein